MDIHPLKVTTEAGLHLLNGKRTIDFDGRQATAVARRGAGASRTR